MTRGPLQGVRILDFTWAWAGPHGTLLLAMLGAEVIKVESHRRLDHTRLRSLMAGPTLTTPDHSVIFNDLNVGKLSINLNLSQPKAVEIAKRIVQISDVVTQNMRPGVLDRLGLGYENLKAVKPDIIMLSSSAVGAIGPERNYTGYAPTFAAMGGHAYISGYPDGPPMPLSGAVDLRVGTTAAFAILAALYYRQRTGKGQNIDLSSSEAVSALIGHTFMDYTMNGRLPIRQGNRDQSVAPHNCYPCLGEDKWVTIVVASDEEWAALRRVIGDPRLEDDKFADGYRRWQNQEALDPIISEWTASRTPEQVTQALQEAGVAALPVHDGPSLVRDPQLRERGVLETIRHPAIGDRLTVTPPWKFSRTPAEVRSPAPLLGQHNQYVLGELLGMPSQEIETLVAEEVVY
ncbi:MAG: CaiB/BaiF CoA transferase family protein [Dehalococcoidia bacterium]